MTAIFQANPITARTFGNSLNSRLISCMDDLNFVSSIMAQLPHDYNKDTRVLVNTLSGKLQFRFKDYRGQRLRVALKRELIEKIQMVCNNTRELCTSEMSQLKDRMAKEQSEVQRVINTRLNQNLVASIEGQKRAYVAGFDNEAEGKKYWDCLMTGVKLGFITKEQLADYGIDA